MPTGFTNSTTDSHCQFLPAFTINFEISFSTFAISKILSFGRLFLLFGHNYKFLNLIFQKQPLKKML